MKRRKIPKDNPTLDPGLPVVGDGWCGIYDTRSRYKLGWIMPHFVCHGRSAPLSENQRKVLGEIRNRQFAKGDMYRVRITIQPVKNARGKFIVRRYRAAKRTALRGEGK